MATTASGAPAPTALPSHELAAPTSTCTAFGCGPQGSALDLCSCVLPAMLTWPLFARRNNIRHFTKYAHGKELLYRKLSFGTPDARAWETSHVQAFLKGAASLVALPADLASLSAAEGASRQQLLAAARSWLGISEVRLAALVTEWQRGGGAAENGPAAQPVRPAAGTAAGPARPNAIPASLGSADTPISLDDSPAKPPAGIDKFWRREAGVEVEFRGTKGPAKKKAKPAWGLVVD